MPELPEVQTIVNDLNRKIKGDVITGFRSFFRAGIKGRRSPDFIKSFFNVKIRQIERIGKYIMFKLSDGRNILFHLGMTGKLIVGVVPYIHPSSQLQFSSFKKQNFGKYTRAAIFLNGGKIITFSDKRKFGKIIFDGRVIRRIIENLGINPLDKKLTFPKFDKILNTSQAAAKNFLLNQKKFSGIGNIYASEILHNAGILPDRLMNSLGGNERKKLFHSVRKILRKAVKLRGTSINDYRDASGKRGKFQNLLKVYQKTGQKCKRCGTIIRRSVIGQRSTFHCPKCQK